VLHFPPSCAPSTDGGYRPELALVWDTLTEWEAMWNFPEVQAHAGDPQDPVTDWQMQNPVDVDLQAPTGGEVPQPPARERPRDDRPRT